MIISGKKLAYLEPQEKVWRGESGQWFDISELWGQDGLAPFHGRSGFNADMTSDYSGTLFRFPLRDTPSELSENVYTVSKLHELFAALREEAKFLLLFLRSVDTIEAVELPQYGREQKLFRVEIAEREQTYRDRKHFMDRLESAHESQSYSISQYINVVTNFHVAVMDGGHTTRSHWLVANQVGSPSSNVHTAAVKQHVFPWVGVALELKDGTAPTPTSSGRVFCFLPMPAEASSPLPVHVNGTFGLNDDRRTLKWPGIERIIDSTAEWNTLLVSQLLPPCYALLLNRAKDFLAPKEYYSAWPEVSRVQYSNWKDLLLPLFRVLMSQPVVWTERSDTKVGRWIVPSEGMFIPKAGNFSLIVHRILSSCGVKLVDVPPRIWEALRLAGFSPTQVTPSLTRHHIRKQGSSYTSVYINAHDKHELLRYCLTDENYSDLKGLFLLPLADGRFVQFESLYYVSQYHYLCSEDYPQDLLPNLNDRLVNLHQNDSDLQSKLQSVASSQKTQLRNLDTQAVAQLLPDCFPQEWRSCQTVSLPHPFFPSQWFETFWRWVRKNQNLHKFTGQLILPVVSSKQSGFEFEATQLVDSSSVLYLSEQCSGDLLQAFSKLQIRYTNPKRFPYLYHNRQLSSYVNDFTPAGILNAIAKAYQWNTAAIQTVVLSSPEAASLQLYLSTQLYSLNLTQRNILMSLPVLCVLNQDKLYSANEVARYTWDRKIVVEPEGFDLHRCLPSKLIILSRTLNQNAFINAISDVQKPSKVELILNVLFPIIRRNEYPTNKIDSLMEKVLQLFPALTQHAENFRSQLHTLPFLKTSSGIRKPPSELFDPSHCELKKLYEGNPVFPAHPFDQQRYKYSLHDCELRQSVCAKEIVEIIKSIATLSATSPHKVDKIKVSRAKAVLKYLASHSAILNEKVALDFEQFGQFCTLKQALPQLASRYSWLPVRTLPPKRYPDCLPWKGTACTSHLTSLHDSVLFPDHGDNDELPTITGSQVYVVDCSPSQELSSIFPSTQSALDHVLMHFGEVIDHYRVIDQDPHNSTTNRIVHMIYNYLYYHRNSLNHASWSRIPQWIWIKKHHKFVAPNVVALKLNHHFRHNLEPYIFVLPDDLQQFSELFTRFGVTNSITQSQIISVLKMIKDTKSSQLEADGMWSIVMSILRWLTNNGENRVKLDDDEVLYVPVDSASKLPQLMAASEVVYTDNAFLKDFLASSDQEEQEYTFAHHRIHPNMAHCLGLTPLSEHLNIAADTFADIGQYETLTQRLKNILREYDGGLTIVKELIQNADDAGATEINICYDARKHDIPPERLLYPGMAKSHGPALIVHNDASFTDEDFQNIQKLAAATKEDKPLKIGKFGVGFCSVYHITDVPSFVSHDSMCIFDPTLQHLKKEIKNPARPGKKVKFTERIVTSSQQLMPFAGLYNFDPKKCYDGTIFRLPFRTSSSEISGIKYNVNIITKLKEGIQTSGSKLLLFLQHVKRLTFSRISDGKHSPEVLVDIRRENSILEKVIVLHSTLHNPSHERYEQWLVSSHTDTITFNHTRKYATAAVACQLECPNGDLHSRNKTVYTPVPITGEVFCFLPLTLHTGLPVHVSANFAVASNRKGIRSSDEESYSHNCRKDIQWNVDLMKEVIPKAYLNLLTSLQQMCSDKKIKKANYEFFSLWPLQGNLKTHNPWKYFIESLYKLICSSNVFYCNFLSQWQTLAESKILSPGILCKSTDQSTPDCVVKVIEQFQLPVVELPLSYQEHFSQGELKDVMLNEKEFLQRFFKNIHELGSGRLVHIRNRVLKCMLQAFAVASESHTKRTEYLQNYLHSNACIPCTPGGQVLKNCTEIIDPKVSFAELYDPDDSVFPIQELIKSKLIHGALSQLGMISNFMPWSMLIERARSIWDRYSTDKHKALKRVKLILECTNTNLLKTQQSILATDHEPPQESRELSAIKFLPVMQKPSDYPLQWCGEGSDLLSPKELLRYSKSNTVLVGSQLAIVCELTPSKGGCGGISHTIQTALEIQTTPKHDEVLKHLCHLIEVISSQHPCTPTSTTPAIKCEWVDRSCSEIYKFFESQLSDKKIATGDLTELQHKPCVWSGKQSVLPSAVAENWEHNGPYLFRVPHTLRYQPHLTAALGIKKEFGAEDFLCTLQRIHKVFGSKPVDDECKRILFNIIQSLDQAIIETEPLKLSQTCFLPDNSLVMHDAKTLVFNDAPWCEADEEWTVVHSSIARNTALKLGVKPVLSKMLKKYESTRQHFAGVPFGQKELLTQRIQNILREYPFDVTVLKELLQNADDAKATKMYVILDKRQHGTESLPSPEWKDLQGPALLVWNDSVFSEENLEGIQRLGLGNKRTDAESIGMYGIGFNVVYHLTDCPSFISNGTTLCVLDPHCRYVPGADEQQPGRRYDNLDSRFWNKWADLKTAYLRDGTWPDELKRGSLFRFPLRSTTDLVKNSQLVDHSDAPTWGSLGHDQSKTPLTRWRMEKYLNEWIPKMQQALFFLNHVTELKFFVIKDVLRGTPEMQLTRWFEVSVDQAARESRTRLFTIVRDFTGQGSETHTVMYPLTITEKSSATEPGTSQSWLIQQGVGDSMKQDQQWMYSPQIKPKHGIAAHINLKSDPKKTDLLSGAVFCFLPLPISSGLPVHVNGNFILDATRRNLWHGTNPDDPDDRMKWNLMLFEAIASSYTKFLVDAQQFYVKSGAYGSRTFLWNDIQHYYNVFPTWLKTRQDTEQSPSPPEHVFLKLAKMVYRKLADQNETVLVSIMKIQEIKSSPTKSKQLFSVEWHPLLNNDNPSKQGYFWKPSPEEKGLAPILERIGMNLVAAPLRLQKHFANLDTKVELPIPSRQSVYEYYSSFYQQVSETGFPCHIRSTAFQSTNNFIKFTEYFIPESTAVTLNPQNKAFPESPFGLPLLLTADEQLWKFDEQNKVIKSSFVNLFPKCRESFLHPSMLKFPYMPTYFLKPSTDNSSLIYSILSPTLPGSLRVQRVQVANQHIKLQHELKPLWECLSSDPVFRKHLKEIVSIWALLPSTDDQLFSFRSNDQLLPVCLLSEGQPMLSPVSLSESLNPIIPVLRSTGMPLLDTDVAGPVVHVPFCPKVSEHGRILTNLYHMYQEGALGQFLASSGIERNIITLFEYFRKIHFADDPDSLQKIKALPLFKNIDGNLCTLLGDAYVWPGSICQAGREKWVKEANVVFLKKDDVWTELGSASVLGIRELTILEVYTQYIFPHFHLFSEEEQLKQLQHIRDGLFKDAKRESESTSDLVEAVNRKLIANQFISALKDLPCLMHNGNLKPVRDFSDPKVVIFTTFRESFIFLPEELSDDKWLEFFRKIGLQTKVTREDFIRFCRKVSFGDHRELQKASLVLLGYLFDAKDWYSDYNHLREVSTISFVCTETLSELSWIQPTYPAENRMQFGSTIIDMTKLCGAVLLKNYRIKNSQLVWTVKSVVKLPTLPDPINKSDIAKKFYEALGVIISPNPEDVIHNILNISRTRFSHFSLFDKYTSDCRTKKQTHSSLSSEHLLLEVLQENFKFLKQSSLKVYRLQDSLQQLTDATCIPVCREGNTIGISEPVLVLPQQVVASSPEEVRMFHPFINPLPDCLYSAVPGVLSVLGVITHIQASHIRLALETAYKHIQQPLDPNTKNALKYLLRKLYSLLRDSELTLDAAILQPLYLLNTEDQLVESKYLLYKDKSHYKEHSFNLSSSPYSLFSLPAPKHEMGFTEKAFCQYLPPGVSPKALSACIDEVLNVECANECEEQSPYATRLMRIFGFKNFATAAYAMLRYGSSSVDEQLCTAFRASLEWFLKNLQVTTIENLQADIILKITQPPQNIGTAKVDFLLQKKDCSFFVYIDANVTLTLGLRSFEALVNSIVLHVAQRGQISLKDLDGAEKAIDIILRAESELELSEQLEELEMPVDSIGIDYQSFNPNLQPELGKPIPETWLHRLDMDVHNTFKPEEWVGYEVREGHVVFAIVVHRIRQVEQESEDAEPMDQYLIRTSPDDQEGNVVNVLYLYKILRSAELQRNPDGSQTLCLFNPDSETSQLRKTLDTDDLKSIKKQIFEELQHIWKLPDDQRRKAIQRLYLKWHPDKCSHPLATKAFQYLRRQVERLEVGRPLEEPDQEEDTTPYEPSPRWRGWYNMWNSWANRSQRARDRERDFYTSGSNLPGSVPVRPEPQPEIARVWLKQAEVDLKALKTMLVQAHGEQELCGHVCFLAHEVAERALKAGKYAVCGLHPDSLQHHNIMGHAGALEEERRQDMSGLRQRAQTLENRGYYVKTRFPNQYTPPAVPAEHFNLHQAEEAATCAEEILDMMRQLIN